MTKYAKQITNRKSRLQRFEEKYIPEPNSGCWLWTAYVSDSGYGSFYIPKKGNRANRSAWLLYYGEIPGGKIICHKCDTPSCVNPMHLFIGTSKDNTADCIKKGRDKTWANRKLGDDSPFTKIKSSEKGKIKYLYRTLHQREIAEIYGVAQSQISLILRDKRGF